MPLDLDSTSVQDYLKALYKLQQTHERVNTNLLAEHLRIAPPSVTAMIKRLAAAGLADYQPYQGCRLTEQGERIALKMVRRHRILEQFLQQMLQYRWDEVDAEAEVLEHAVSDKFIERLWQLMDCPRYDPHGAPIPDADGRLPDADTCPLCALREGQRACIRKLCLQGLDVDTPATVAISPETLAHRLQPGTPVELTRLQDHALQIETPHGALKLPQEIARHIHVKPL